ncbi:MAG: thiolase domain-containing protein [Conexivisphaerales archaeon]
MRRVAILGAGQSRFGKRTDVRLDELAWESFREAMVESGVTQRDIDSFIVSTLGGWSAEVLPAVVVGEYCGLTPKPTMRVEAACASGSAAVYQAYTMIASGHAEVVSVIGVEKMSESSTPTTVELIGRAGNYFWEFENYGMTFPAYYALYASSYMSRYGATEEDLALVAVKNHYYGSFNPKAHFQRRISVDDVMKSIYVADPLKLLDCSPITDGSATVILASEESVKKFTNEPVWIRGIGAASGTANLSKRDNFLGLEAARKAADDAYKQANIERPISKLDLVEAHDCFTIAEVMAYEDLRLVERGEGYKLIKEEQTYKGGKIPVNLSGGLKAKGHPIGATGVSMIGELSKQLLGRIGGERQADIKHGWALAHNVGGTGHYAYVTILSLDKNGDVL